jgi:hypothetical protein
MDPTNSRIYLSRNVVFDETCFPAKEMLTPPLLAGNFSSPLGTALLPSHFFFINSLTFAHPHDIVAFPEASVSSPEPLTLALFLILFPTLFLPLSLLTVPFSLKRILVSPHSLHLSPALPCSHLPLRPLLPLLPLSLRPPLFLPHQPSLFGPHPTHLL